MAATGPFALNLAVVGSVVAVPVGDQTNTIAFDIAGLTSSGAVVSFEYSDTGGTIWRPLRYMTTATVAGALTANTDGAFTLSTAGHTNMRVRVTTAGTGSASVFVSSSIGIRTVNLEGAGTGPLAPLYTSPVAIAGAAGLSQFTRLATGDTNTAVIKAGAGKVFGYQIFNLTATTRYLRLYNKATAPSPAADAGLIVRRLAIPPNGVASYALSLGLDGFTNGIAMDATGGIADTDTTVLSANDLMINVDFL